MQTVAKCRRVRLALSERAADRELKECVPGKDVIARVIDWSITSRHVLDGPGAVLRVPEIAYGGPQLQTHYILVLQEHRPEGTRTAETFLVVEPVDLVGALQFAEKPPRPS